MKRLKKSEKKWAVFRNKADYNLQYEFIFADSYPAYGVSSFLRTWGKGKDIIVNGMIFVFLSKNQIDINKICDTLVHETLHLVIYGHVVRDYDFVEKVINEWMLGIEDCHETEGKTW